MKVRIATRRVEDGSWRADVVNIDEYIEHVTGRRPAEYEHYFRYEYDDSPGEAVEALLERLAREDGFIGEWELV